MEALHTIEEIKALNNRQDYIDALVEMHSRFKSISNLGREIYDNKVIVETELAKYQSLIGTNVSYKGLFSNKVREGKITKILHFCSNGVSVIIDYNTNGFDTTSLSKLTKLD